MTEEKHLCTYDFQDNFIIVQLWRRLEFRSTDSEFSIKFQFFIKTIFNIYTVFKCVNIQIHFVRIGVRYSCK